MSARENEAFDNLQGNFFSSHDADEVILLNDFAKDLEPQNPKSLIGQEVTLRYGEHQQLAADPGSSGTAGRFRRAECSAELGRRLRLLGSA